MAILIDKDTGDIAIKTGTTFFGGKEHKCVRRCKLHAVEIDNEERFSYIDIPSGLDMFMFGFFGGSFAAWLLQ